MFSVGKANFSEKKYRIFINICHKKVAVIYESYKSDDGVFLLLFLSEITYGSCCLSGG